MRIVEIIIWSTVFSRDARNLEGCTALFNRSQDPQYALSPIGSLRWKHDVWLRTLKIDVEKAVLSCCMTSLWYFILILSRISLEHHGDYHHSALFSYNIAMETLLCVGSFVVSSNLAILLYTRRHSPTFEPKIFSALILTFASLSFHCFPRRSEGQSQWRLL